MRPNAMQRRLLVLMTAAFTFFGGFLLARGNEPGFVATLVAMALGWLLLAVVRPQDKPGR